jgi:hypothetical protein
MNKTKTHKYPPGGVKHITPFLHRRVPPSVLAVLARHSPSTTPRGTVPARGATAPADRRPDRADNGRSPPVGRGPRPAGPRWSSCRPAARHSWRQRRLLGCIAVLSLLGNHRPCAITAGFIFLALAREQLSCAWPGHAGTRDRPRTLRCLSAGCCAACATPRLRVQQ